MLSDAAIGKRRAVDSVEMSDAERKQSYWERQLMDTCVLIKLTSETKHWIEVLFHLIDADKSGTISKDDFVLHEGGEVVQLGGDDMPRWTLLQSQLDLNGDGEISEFIFAIQIIVLKEQFVPASPTFVAGQATVFDVLKELNHAMNAGAQALCKKMHDFLKTCRAHQDEQVHAAEMAKALKRTPSSGGVLAPDPINVGGDAVDYLRSVHTYLNGFRGDKIVGGSASC